MKIHSKPKDSKYIEHYLYEGWKEITKWKSDKADYRKQFKFETNERINESKQMLKYSSASNLN